MFTWNTPYYWLLAVATERIIYALRCAGSANREICYILRSEGRVCVIHNLVICTLSAFCFKCNCILCHFILPSNVGFCHCEFGINCINLSLQTIVVITLVFIQGKGILFLPLSVIISFIVLVVLMIIILIELANSHPNMTLDFGVMLFIEYH